MQNHKLKIFIVTMLALAFAGCATVYPLGFTSSPTTYNYTEPKQSGLRGIRPYPSSNDVCLVLTKTATISHLFSDGVTLIGCPKHEFGAIKDRRNEGAKIIDQAKHWTILQLPSSTTLDDNNEHSNNPKQSSTANNVASVPTLRAFIANSTTTSWDPIHGTQLEYNDREGGAWLVYPGNGRVLPGEWKVDVIEGSAKVCYRYFSAGKNPATGVIGYEWECSPAQYYISKSNTQFYKGDIFQLYNRDAFPDSPQLRNKLSLEQLLTLFGITTQPEANAI